MSDDTAIPDELWNPEAFELKKKVKKLEADNENWRESHKRVSDNLRECMKTRIEKIKELEEEKDAWGYLSNLKLDEIDKLQEELENWKEIGEELKHDAIEKVKKDSKE